jgi:O-antigen ligase
MSFWCAKRTSLLYLPLLIYSFLSLLALSVWPEQPYKSLFDPVTTLALQKNALYGMMVWIIGCVSLASISKKQASAVRITLVSIWAIGTLGVLCQPWTGPLSSPNQGLWFGNPSMGVGLLAILMPHAWAMVISRVKNPWKIRALFLLTWCLTVLAIVKTRASVPIGVLGVVTAAVWISQKGMRRFYPWVVVAVLAGALVVAGKAYLGHDFWDQNGRFEIWGMAWEYFWQNANPAFGFGYASSQVMLPIEQVFSGHFHQAYFLWLHNDWLQLAVEGGWVGMACVFLALSRLLVLSYRRSALFGSLCGFVALACFNYPLRMPIHCMCLMLICGITEAYAVKKPVKSRESWLRLQRKVGERTRLKPLGETGLAGFRSHSQSLEPSKSPTPSC